MKRVISSWSVIGKVLGGAVVFALLCNRYPGLAGISGVITALCVVAYWRQCSSPVADDGTVAVDCFKRQLELLEQSRRSAISIENSGSGIVERLPVPFSYVKVTPSHYQLIDRS